MTIRPGFPAAGITFAQDSESSMVLSAADHGLADPLPKSSLPPWAVTQRGGMVRGFWHVFVFLNTPGVAPDVGMGSLLR